MMIQFIMACNVFMIERYCNDMKIMYIASMLTRTIKPVQEGQLTNLKKLMVLKYNNNF